MNTGGNRTRRNARRRANRRRSTRPVVVVRPTPKPRRVRRRRASAGGGAVRGPGGRSNREVFTFTVDDLKANSSGILKFGPNLSQYAAFNNGILKAYHEYKITSLTIQYNSCSSSTTSGAIALEVDTSCSQTTTGSKIVSFPVKSNTRKTFPTSFIRGKDFVTTTADQFWLLYKGNGDSSLAGQFVCRFECQFQNPK
ncbi:P3 protein [Wheat leaf yellowing-associated virus]|nr:P3 protein [Wheat leaf yellowing-associated virus]ASK51773.1 P3 protein [Wheat leaf yellowing-associated virus]